ncbi:hypothetical protein HBI56_123420 [Parastagonospora nodorum]|uniref:C3H1-type domain-containing protein n=2 Tax=Phaeosphaeria nodorum (strain SN15 / ATCC MYA-4574 / FGSC 10173) TaxID=321614 RepID=A0A7U2I3W7_PHANO|nr:hypothetical protein HBH56_164690 [Parastagonospora nodorum]QRC98427.1 hypothetical protein JI435_044880 [Parastagonospora nodorum SN15]KAH3936464.1 hypothetical protein HBH54_027780 [Parastagonospora nodorum]KAH3948322.1 hypothetical protein HBH53_102600 [Parastagonospora nodorum]KAH3968698.1 hypothetical protein HBH51_126470 [Parastagonospora nodorum]
MKPPGAPPHSLADILKMTDPEERLRARAELLSYIARVKKERGEPASEPHVPNGYTSYGPRAPPIAPSGTHIGHGYRGGYGRGRGRGGRAAYHPYQRPQQFRNKSVTFNKQDLAGDAPESEKAAPLTTDGTYINHGPHQHTEPQTPCPQFTMTGICSRHGCRYLHDPEKQAICKPWLFKGECPKGDACLLSHSPTPHNTPMCKHFQDGRCNKDDCRFSHVRISPAAPNCEAFGLVGYCEKGADCSELHAHECPHFSNTGSCRYGDKCRLGHVHRASRMRKATRKSPDGLSSPEGSSRQNSNDADAETWTPGATPDPHQFTQQYDYVSLDADD